MSWAICWSRAAKGDLLDIWLYIAHENLAAADRQIDRIENAVNKLSDYPRLGPARHDVGPEVRGLIVNRYLVLYRILESAAQLELLRVIDGRRDLSAVFSGGEP